MLHDIPINIILLNRDVKRCKNVNILLKTLEPNLTNKILNLKTKNIVKVHSAVDGNHKQLIEDLLTKHKIKVSGNLKMGQIGCALSHYQLWNILVKSNNQFMIILEDDSKIIDKVDIFYQKINNVINETSNNFDWIYLYVFPSQKISDKSLHFSTSLDHAYHTYCTIGYIISKSGASKLINRLKILNSPLDTIISQEIMKKNLKAFSVKDNIIDNLGQKTSSYDSGLPSNIWYSKFHKL